MFRQFTQFFVNCVGFFLDYACVCAVTGEFENSQKNKPKKKKKSASLDGSDEEFSDGGGGMVWNFLDVL